MTYYRMTKMDCLFMTKGFNLSCYLSIARVGVHFLSARERELFADLNLHVDHRLPMRTPLRFFSFFLPSFIFLIFPIILLNLM